MKKDKELSEEQITLVDSKEWDDFVSKVESRPGYAESKKQFDAEYAIAFELEKQRKACGLSQKEIAERMNKKQSAVSRLENNHMSASLKSLSEYAHAMGKTVKIEFI